MPSILDSSTKVIAATALAGTVLSAQNPALAQIRSQIQQFTQSFELSEFGELSGGGSISTAPNFTVEPFSQEKGFLESVRVAWIEEGVFSGRSGRREAALHFTTGGTTLIDKIPYGSYNVSENSNSGPESSLALNFKETASDRTFSRDHTSGYFGILGGSDPFRIRRSSPSVLRWNGIKEGLLSAKTTASVTYNYLDVLPIRKTAVQKLVSNLRYGDFTETDSMSSVLLGPISFTVQPFNTKLGKLRGVEIDWQTDSLFEGVAGSIHDIGVAIMETSGTLYIGSESYSGHGSGGDKTGQTGSPISLTLAPSRITRIFEEDSASLSHPEIWSLLSDSKPYTISYSNPGNPANTVILRYRNIASGLAQFPYAATVSYIYLPFREPTDTGEDGNTVPGPLPAVGCGIALQWSRVFRKRISTK